MNIDNPPRLTQEKERRLKRDKIKQAAKEIVRGSAQEKHLQSQVEGLLLGVKPAVLGQFSDGQDRQAILERLRAEGIDAIISGNVIADVGAVAMRVAEESELAAEVGWDTARSFEENLSRASAKSDLGPQAEALMGFILGFPASAIRNYRRVGELAEMGIHRPILYRHMDFPAGLTKEETFTMIQLREALNHMDQELRTAPSPESAAEFEFEQTREISAAWSDRLARIFSRLGASDEDIRLTMSYDVDYISSPDGGLVYYFMSTNDESGAPRADVTGLKRKVEKAFKDAGF